MSPDELDLSAFRFVAGDMAAEESAAFEARLADDQAARLAVSRAVGLTQLLWEAAPPITQAARPLRSSIVRVARCVGWAAVGAAVALLAVHLASRPAAGPRDAGRAAAVPAQRSTPPADALVFARLQADDVQTAAELQTWLDQPLLGAEDAGDPLVMTDVPSWVFASQRALTNGDKP